MHLHRQFSGPYIPETMSVPVEMRLLRTLVLRFDFRVQYQSFGCLDFTDTLYALNCSSCVCFSVPVASFCLACQSKYALVPSSFCKGWVANCPSPRLADGHSFREAMQAADFPKWTYRDSGNSDDLPSASQCALLSPPTQFLANFPPPDVRYASLQHHLVLGTLLKS